MSCDTRGNGSEHRYGWNRTSHHVECFRIGFEWIDFEISTDLSASFHFKLAGECYLTHLDIMVIMTVAIFQWFISVWPYPYCHELQHSHILIQHWLRHLLNWFLISSVEHSKHSSRIHHVEPICWYSHHLQLSIWRIHRVHRFGFLLYIVRSHRPFRLRFVHWRDLWLWWFGWLLSIFLGRSWTSN